MTRLITLIAVATLLAAGCGGGGRSSAAVTADVAEDYCRDSCVYQHTCNPQSEQTIEACTASCVEDVVGVIREDAFVAIIECFNALACDADNDLCLQECVPTSAHNTYESACRANLGQCDLSAAQLDGICEVSPSSSADNEVGFWCLIAPAIINEMTACLGDGACQEQLTCLQAALERNGVD